MIAGRTILCFASGYDAPPTSKHHIMHELARRNRVLWVNYHGSRKPSMSGGDLRYLGGRLESRCRPCYLRQLRRRQVGTLSHRRRFF